MVVTNDTRESKYLSIIRDGFITIQLLSVLNPNCQYKTRDKYLLKKHKLVHSPENQPKIRSLVCGINGCDKRYATKITLYGHQRRSHNNPILVCTHRHCRYKTRDKYLMKNHESVHSSDRPFKCTVDGCEFASTTQGKLNSHMKVVHSIGRTFKCTHEGCGSAFKCKYTLQMHYMRRHTEKRLTCDWPGCDYRCVYSHTLVIHQRVHTNDQRFVCDWPECQYKSKWSSGLSKHKTSVHGQEKLYPCHWPGCDYTGNTDNLRRHYRRHSLERNFVCDHPNCGKAFTTQEYLTTHSSCHSSVKPFVCQFPDCNYRSAFRSSLSNHNKRYHK